MHPPRPINLAVVLFEILCSACCSHMLNIFDLFEEFANVSLLGLLGASRNHLGASWALLVGWGPLGPSWAYLGSLLGRLGGLLKPPGRRLGVSWGVLAAKTGATCFGTLCILGQFEARFPSSSYFEMSSVQKLE